MQINFSKTISDLDGNPYREGAKALTLGDVSAKSLHTPTQKTMDLSLEDKMYRGELAAKVHKSTTLDVSVEDVALMREAIAASGHNYHIVYVCCGLLDPKVREVAAEKQK